jgi:hypothetical protein
MNCNCITDIKNQLLDIKVGPREKKAISASILSGAIMRVNNRMELVTTSEFELTLDGQKKKEIQNIVHSFCPFCGIKIDFTPLTNRANG